ncbi:MAG: LTA synthase family protein [Bacteroidaceae bacterium]|nr:LTA synthase family protein [Bacteroidaceae bacterium]
MKQKEYSETLLTLYIQIWCYQAVGILLLSIARILHLSDSLQSLVVHHTNSVPLFLWNSWRFDIQSITYISLPIIVGSLIIFYLGKKVVERFTVFMQWYYTVMLTILSGIVIAEFFFEANFNSRYNIVFFDFFNEGPLELLQTMWQDYPLLGVLIVICAISFVIWLVGSRIKHLSIKSFELNKPWMTIAFGAMIICLTFIFMRGSITRYTLQVEAFVVSVDENINKAVPNAMYLLKKAYKEKINNFRLYSDEDLMKQEGFSTLDEVIATAGFPISCEDDNEKKVTEVLFARAKGNHAQGRKQPNVLIILCESWSRFLLEMDKGDSLDLQCSMRKHLEEDLFWGNIQSVRNGTIYSLETVTMSMPYPHFFNSRYRFRSLPTSIAHPFKESGYSTAFITGMDPTWENVQEGLSHQSFDTIIGRRNILQSISGSTTSAIGVYDEFLFSYIQHYLEGNDDDRPKFILALTTTNHPPFTYPEDMRLPPLNEKWYESPYLTGDRAVLKKYGMGAQYTNKSLGDFLEKVKSSALADNTIVLATGDHNVRSILNYKVVPQVYKHAVPMYLYLPGVYRMDRELEKKVTCRYGSHFDILPTLAPLVLNEGVSYLSIGQNLLDTTKCNKDYYGYNEKQMLSPDVRALDSLSEMMHARELLMKIYYQQKFRE